MEAFVQELIEGELRRKPGLEVVVVLHAGGGVQARLALQQVPEEFERLVHYEGHRLRRVLEGIVEEEERSPDALSERAESCPIRARPPDAHEAVRDRVALMGAHVLQARRR